MKKFSFKKIVGGLVAFVAAGSASAALPTEATTAFTTIQADGAALAALAWPLAIAIATALVLFGLFKKFVSKAT